MRTIICSISFVASVTLVSPASGQDDPCTNQRQKAERDVKAGRTARALETLHAAYQRCSNPVDLIRIARIHQDTGNLEAALRYVEQFLAVAEPSHPHRSALAAAAADLKKKIAEKKPAGSPIPAPGPMPANPTPEPPIASKTDAAAPWVRGVSDADQKKALALFQKGNDFFPVAQYSQAIRFYSEAIALWDHPAIHFNIAVCYVHLDQPLLAHSHLERALAYGQPPLGQRVHNEALTYQKLLNGQVARITISAEQAGVRVSLDGRDLFVGPGKADLVVLPGPHELVARHATFMTETRRIDARAGQTSIEALTLVAFENAPTRMERRFATWYPWASIGTGAGLGLVGLWLHLDAKSDYKKFGNALDEFCPSGCERSALPSVVTDLEQLADTKRGLSVAAFALGTTFGVGGVVLLILNQPRPVPMERNIEIQPLIDKDTVGAAASVPF